MLPWKRKELYVGNSYDEVLRIRNILDANHVDYDLRSGELSARNMQPRSVVMGRWGNVTEDARRSENMYYIYVGKDQLEAARELIRARE